jgi:hypothetical protein
MNERNILSIKHNERNRCQFNLSGMENELTPFQFELTPFQFAVSVQFIGHGK